MSFQIIFVLAIQNDWFIYKIDIKSAFTQDYLTKTVYINQSEEFINKEYLNKILKLNKTLYDLKQSTRIWYNTLSKKLKILWFNQLNSNNYIYQNETENTIITVYVNDLVIFGLNINYIKSIIKELSLKFDLKDLRLIRIYLEIDIIPNKNSIILNQKNYIEKILKRFNFDELNPNFISIDPKLNREPSKNTAEKEDIKWY